MARKRKSKNHNERLRMIEERENQNLANKKIEIESNSFETGTKKMKKMFEKTQEMKISNKDAAKLTKSEKEAIARGEKEYESTRGLSDGAVNTYFKTFERVRKEIYVKFNISDPTKINHEHTKAIIQDRIAAGQSANTITKVVHAIGFVQTAIEKTDVFQSEKEIEIIDKTDMLQYLKEEDIVRHASDSHRYKADANECKAVIDELYNYQGGKYKDFADLARMQFLSGGRRSEVIGLLDKEVHVPEGIVEFNDAKGGLDNKVWVNHWSKDDKNFVSSLVQNADEDGKIFRIKGESGQYLSEEKTAEKLNRLLGQVAKKLGIGTEEKNFTSHSLRGGYGHARVDEYTKLKATPGGIDSAIQQKIAEQPRLLKRYQSFEKHIRNNLKEANRASREIQDYEKIQWLVSVDLNHSRQDIVRYYVDGDYIKNELGK